MGGKRMFRLKRTIIKSCVCNLVFTILVFAGLGSAQGPPTVPVCELLNDVKNWSEKTVAVRGILGFGSESLGVYEVCDSDLIIEGPRWQSSISFTNAPEGEALEGADPRSITFLTGLMRLFRETYAGSRFADRRDPFVITATFVGRLKTLRTYKAPDRTDPGEPGFGHMYLDPAELQLIAVKDISVTEDRSVPWYKLYSPEQQ